MVYRIFLQATGDGAPIMNVEYGNELEEFVLDALKAIANATRRNTAGGAGMPEDSDLRTNNLQIECKRLDSKDPEWYKKQKSINLKKAWIVKLIKRSQVSGKLPMLVTSGKNMDSTAWVHMPLRVFLEMVDPEKL